MKQIFSLVVFSLITSGIFSQNQVIQNQETYDRLKADGKLDPTISYTIQSDLSKHNNTRLISKSSVKSSANQSVPCGVVETDNFQDPWGGDVYFDDSPPAGPFEVQIPFTFCFYDQQYSSFFINNNGNITFDAQYTTFTSTGFPSADVPPMIAPFWGDVDTGDSLNPLGQVRFEVYSDYAVVSWDSVGVYPGSDPNQRNTFQLIITDGVSPVLPPQTNICFIFGDMQWTTGTASQGTGGFGGTPATVGVNRGDGVDYIQLGRFDAPGTAYDGPFNNNDGVDYLDNSIFFFNTCLSSGQNNIAPLSIGAPICDTLVVCTGGTIPINFFFIPVEPGQEVDAELLTSEIPGLNIDTIIAGEQCEVIGNFTGTTNNQGFNTISFLATDNGTPAAEYQLEIVIQVLPSNFTPIISGTPAICSGESTFLSVEGGPFEQYVWAPNLNQSPTTEITESSTVTVTVAGNGQCGVSEPFEVIVAESPLPTIAGQSNVCADQTTVLYTTQPYAQYAWSTASSNDSITALPGQYIVTVIDENGCQGTSSIFTVTSGNTFVPEIIGAQVLCPNETLELSSIEPYAFYYWSNGSSDSVAYITEPGVYTLFAVNNEGCSGTSNPYTVNQDTILPALPAIINAGGLLFTAYTEPIYWFLDGQVIAENVNFIQISEPGQYSYAAISEYGCFVFSDTFNVQITSLNRHENNLQPIVNTYTESGWIFRSNMPDYSYALFSADGRCVKVGKCESVIDASLLSSGIYLLNINTDVDSHVIKLIRR